MLFSCCEKTLLINYLKLALPFLYNCRILQQKLNFAVKCNANLSYCNESYKHTEIPNIINNHRFIGTWPGTDNSRIPKS